ncbi:MAG: type II toxin-antitoxin system VapC family toxin [Candidatus Lokiarchaeota archaeon]|nr:type II toxin-antitoxin system VapC family toxin [Candidatus Lokiarchaeota archaeon]
MKKLFLDSGPIIARVNDKDPDHDLVQKQLQKLKDNRLDFGFLYTTNYVIDEAVTHVLYSTKRHDMAVKVLDLLESSGLIHVLWIDRDTETRARAIFRRYADQRFSFTDCTSFAAMEQNEINHAFTFDGQHFKAMNFSVIP